MSASRMQVALTGATGFVGSHVLTELHEHGHEVIALVRNEVQAEVVKDRGAAPAVVDLYDRPAVARVLSEADGAIHTASPVTKPARTWTPRWLMQGLMHSRAPASLTYTSAGCGSTALTPRSPRSPI